MKEDALEKRWTNLLESARKVTVAETRRTVRVAVAKLENGTEVAGGTEEASVAETSESASERVTLRDEEMRSGRGRREGEGRTATQRGILRSFPPYSLCILSAVWRRVRTMLPCATEKSAASTEERGARTYIAIARAAGIVRHEDYET